MKYFLVFLFHLFPQNFSFAVLFLFSQHYMIKWNCTGCYYRQRTGQKTCPGTNCTIPNLLRGHRYSFSVQAVTDFGSGEISVISLLISVYYGKVRNLQASVHDDYNMTVTWDPPLNVDTKDIKVTCQSLKTRHSFCCCCCFGCNSSV